jgi:hypothetical protein
MLSVSKRIESGSVAILSKKGTAGTLHSRMGVYEQDVRLLHPRAD